MQIALADEAVIDHDPDTGECVGWVLEPSATNYILQSEDFSTTWVTNETTVSTDNAVAPDGATTADKLVATSNLGTHSVSQTFTSTTSTRTFFVFAKKDEYSHIALRLFDGTTEQALVYFDLDSGAVGTEVVGTGQIKALKNGYYQCIVRANSMAASASATAEIFVCDADNSNSFTGNDSDGVIVWGAQVEIYFVSSYIKTTTAQVTRANSTGFMADDNVSSWFNQTEGTFYIEQSYTSSFGGGTFGRGNSVMFFLSKNGLNNFNNQLVLGAFLFNGPSFPKRLYANDTSGGVFTALVNANTVINEPIDALNKIAMAYAFQYFAITAGGANVASSTNTLTRPVFDRVNFASTYDGSRKFGRIKKIAYYPTQHTNNQLQVLTT
jgi:hypothetical protein